MTESYVPGSTPAGVGIPAPAGGGTGGRHSKPDPTPPPAPAARPAARGAQARVGSAVKLSAAQSEAVRGTRLLLRQHERTDLEELLANRLRAQPGPPVVAVIGEAKRGKSTLVNALLGQRDLVPTGTDITTGVFVEVHCAGSDGADPEDDAETTEAPATVGFVDGTSRAVPLRDVRDWVAVGGRPPGTPEGADPPDVAGVRVRTGPGRLPGAVLVDTPGAGGLDGGHARLALQSCRKAALLVFVTDAGQPLSAPELAFLTEASRTVERVVIALTKIDKFPAHQQIAAEIRGLLQRHAPRFAADPIVPVSGELALQASAASGSLAAELDEFSGLPALIAEIERALADRNVLAVRNVLRTAEHGLQQLGTDVQHALDVARGTPGAASTADRERAELIELRERQHTWSIYLDRDLRQARSATMDRLGRDADRLRNVWRERLDRARAAYTRAVAEQATVALRADLHAMACAAAIDLRDGVSTVVEQLLGKEAAEGLIPAAPVGELATLGREAPAGLRKLLDPSLLLVANGAGAAGAAAMVHAGWIGAAAGGPPVWALGVVGIPALALISMYRQGHAAQRRLAEWATEEVNRVRGSTIAALDDLLNVLKPEIMISYRGLLTARISALDRIVKEALEAERSDSRNRQRRTSELELQLTAVRAQQEAVRELLN
jgi:GTP-binding protein EngB required for normal cell division